VLVPGKNSRGKGARFGELRLTPMKDITFYPTGKNKLAFLSDSIERMFAIMNRYGQGQGDALYNCYPQSLLWKNRRLE
jgi:hypothetical protein